MKRGFFRAVLCMLLMLTMTVAPAAVCPNFAAQAASSIKVLKTNVESGRLREGPSSEYDVITTLKKGQTVFYSGKMKNAFCYVCTADGQKGFIYKEFLSSYGTVISSRVYYTTGKNVRLYKKASTGASYSTLSKQQYVVVYKKAGNWAYVRTLDGKAGYIPVSKLKCANW